VLEPGGVAVDKVHGVEPLSQLARNREPRDQRPWTDDVAGRAQGQAGDSGVGGPGRRVEIIEGEGVEGGRDPLGSKSRLGLALPREVDPAQAIERAGYGFLERACLGGPGALHAAAADRVMDRATSMR
jgi:hypothetical protein